MEITMTEKVYIKNGKSFKLVETIESPITEVVYNAYINAVAYFRCLGSFERITKGYTPYGYIATKLLSIEKHKSKKIVREFKFK